MRTIVAERVLPAMPGGTRSRLALYSDGFQYVLKGTEISQGSNVLANEFIAAGLLGAIGLPTRPSYPIKCRFGQYCVFESDQQDSIEVSPCDLLLASELVEADQRVRLYSFLPSSFISRIENREMFLGAFVFDIWAGSTDFRQAVYVANRDAKTFRAMFLDNGHLFGGPHWNFPQKIGTAICREEGIYANLFSPDAISAWTFRIATTVKEVLPNLIRTVPTQWYKGDISHLQEILLSRARSLPALFWNEVANLGEPLRGSFRGIYDTSHHPSVLPG